MALKKEGGSLDNLADKSSSHLYENQDNHMDQKTSTGTSLPCLRNVMDMLSVVILAIFLLLSQHCEISHGETYLKFYHFKRYML